MTGPATLLLLANITRTFEVWLCLIFMTLLSPGPFFRVFSYDNLWLYHIDAFGKWSALLFLFCFRLLSPAPLSYWEFYDCFLRIQLTRGELFAQEAKRNIWGWLLQWLHSLKGPAIAFYQDRAVSGLHVLNLSPLEVGILLEMNLLLFILLWQPVCSLLKKWK